MLISKDYISKQYWLKDITADNNIKPIKIRGSYIDIKSTKEHVHIYQESDNTWSYTLNNDENPCKIKDNETIPVGNKKFKIIVTEKRGGFSVLLPLIITLITTLVLFQQSYSMMSSSQKDKKNENIASTDTPLKNNDENPTTSEKPNPTISENSKETTNNTDKNIHAIVAKNDSLFQNNITINWKEYQTNDILKPNLKNGSVEMGISVSEFQGEINWKKVKKAGVNYALIRIGSRGYEKGKLKKDNQFKNNMNKAIANKIKVGCYFYSQAINQKEMDEEINLILQATKNYTLDYPIGISLERDKAKRTNKLSNEEYTDLIKYFCIRMQQNNVTPMIMGKEKWFDRFPKELFDGYLKLVSNEKTAPRNINNCIIWEYDENADGIVNGIDSKLELSISAYVHEIQKNTH